MSDNQQPSAFGPVASAVSFFRLAVFLVFSIPLLSYVVAVSILRPGSAYYRPMLFWVASVLHIFGTKVYVEGLDNFSRDAHYVVMANHRSHLDSFAIAHCLGRERETRWVAKKELLRIPLFGTALKTSGQVIVDRRDHKQAVEALRHSLGDRPVSVVFYPEGSRSSGRQLMPFKKGAAALAIAAGLAVIPVAVSGSEKLLPKYGLRVWPGIIRVRIGSPIEVRGMDEGDRGALTERARSEVGAMLMEMES